MIVNVLYYDLIVLTKAYFWFSACLSRQLKRKEKKKDFVSDIGFVPIHSAVAHLGLFIEKGHSEYKCAKIRTNFKKVSADNAEFQHLS